MTDLHGTWTELSDRLEALGLKLKLHYEQTRDTEVAEAADRIRQGIEDAFEAAGNALRDDAVREDVRDVGRLAAEALAAGLEKIGSEVREATRKS